MDPKYLSLNFDLSSIYIHYLNSGQSRRRKIPLRRQLGQLSNSEIFDSIKSKHENLVSKIPKDQLIRLIESLRLRVKPEIQPSIDGSSNLNKLNDEELEKVKTFMDEDFKKNYISNSNPDFEYDKRVSYAPGKEQNEWDEEDDNNHESQRNNISETDSAKNIAEKEVDNITNAAFWWQNSSTSNEASNQLPGLLAPALKNESTPNEDLVIEKTVEDDLDFDGSIDDLLEFIDEDRPPQKAPLEQQLNQESMGYEPSTDGSRRHIRSSQLMNDDDFKDEYRVDSDELNESKDPFSLDDMNPENDFQLDQTGEDDRDLF